MCDRMKQRVCKCCGKKMKPVAVMQPAAHHVCQDCAAAEEPVKGASPEEKEKQAPNIIFLDRFR